MCDLAEITIRKYEADEITPRLNQMMKIAKALEISDFARMELFSVACEASEAFRDEYDQFRDMIQAKTTEGKVQTKKRTKPQKDALEPISGGVYGNIILNLEALNADGLAAVLSYAELLKLEPKYRRGKSNAEEN
jgi:hypothetical protein